MKQATTLAILLVLCLQAYVEAEQHEFSLERDRRAAEPATICGYNSGGFPIHCTGHNHVRSTTPRGVILAEHTRNYVRDASISGHRKPADTFVIITPARTTPRTVYPAPSVECYNNRGSPVPCDVTYHG